MISTQIREVLELQKQYTFKNTPAMQRRGILIREEIAASLNDNLERFRSKYEIAMCRVAPKRMKKHGVYQHSIKSGQE